jgi:Uma2 family endonuclease
MTGAVRHRLSREREGRRFTAADLARLPSELPSGPVRWELDNGRLVGLCPHGDEHGALEANVATELKLQGERRGHGGARSGESGVVLWPNPDRAVGADALFVANASLPIRRSPEGYLLTIPDPVLEVLSKNDCRSAVQKKIRDDLKAGVRVVWTADPAGGAVTDYRQGAEPVVYGPGDVLTVEDVIPGFRVAVADAFVL